MGGSVSAPASRSAGASPLAGCELLDDRSMVVLPIGFAHATRARSQRRNLAFLEQLGRQGLTASWVAVDGAWRIGVVRSYEPNGHGSGPR